MSSTQRTRQNKGEKGEKECIAYCFRNKNNSVWCMKHFNEPVGIELLDPKTQQVITSEGEIQKAGGMYKADCQIRLLSTNKIWSPSIKSSNCAPPAILNHTPRTAKAFQNQLHEYLPAIDRTLGFYLEKRRNQECREDVLLNDILSDDDDEEKMAWLHVISYFAFSGTGSKPAKCPADSVLIWNGENVTFYPCETDIQKKKYIESLILKRLLKISIRDKGMPTTLTTENRQWLFEDYRYDGTVKIKGSLHIRQMKPKKRKKK